MNEWLIVGTVGAATALLRGAGPTLFGGRPLPDTVGRMVALLGPALLAALVVTQVFSKEGGVVLDERAAGVAAAAVAMRFRAPVLVVVAVAAIVTAVMRAI